MRSHTSTRPSPRRWGALSAMVLLLLASCTTSVESDSGPSVRIDRPIDGATVVTAAVDVTGRFAADGGVAVTARNATTGSSTPCSQASGTFSCADVSLAMGGNSIVVTVTDGQGRTALDAVSVTRGSGEAALRISTPAGAGTTASPTIDVSGTLSGFGSGLVVTIETGAVSDTCTSASEAFSCSDVPLLEGDNLLIVTGEDDAGREAADAIFIEYRPDFSDGGAPSVTITSPIDGVTVADSWVRVVADADDDGVIASVDLVVDGVDVTCDYDDEANVAECLAFLASSSQTVEVRVEDASGNVGSDAITIDRDLAPAAFDIDLEFFDPSDPTPAYSATQLDAFDDAVAFWERVIVGDLQDVPVDFTDGVDPQAGETFACGQGEPAYQGIIDDLRVYVTRFTEDSNVLGFAGPCLSRTSGSDAGTNFVGIMSFNTNYLDQLEADGQLVDTIVHELGHVLGIGTNWDFAPYFDLLHYEPSDGACRNVGTFDVTPAYVGEFGRTAYERLGGTGDVPVEDEGGQGTKCGHWDEATFGNELMTGTLNAGANPLSELTVASLIDLGLSVDLAEAVPYAPPSGLTTSSEGGLDLASREVLLRPRGTFDPRDGRLDLFEPYGDPR